MRSMNAHTLHTLHLYIDIKMIVRDIYIRNFPKNQPFQTLNLCTVDKVKTFLYCGI